MCDSSLVVLSFVAVGSASRRLKNPISAKELGARARVGVTRELVGHYHFETIRTTALEVVTTSGRLNVNSAHDDVSSALAPRIHNHSRKLNVSEYLTA